MKTERLRVRDPQLAEMKWRSREDRVRNEGGGGGRNKQNKKKNSVKKKQKNIEDHWELVLV